MAKIDKTHATHGWYPDWVLNWMTGSDDCAVNTWDESVEHLNTYYGKSSNTYQRNMVLTENTSSWNNTQKEELYEIYVSSSLASEFSSSLGL
tara:strand:+ start:205 stop:480 length:276 start_codon:yes stop_codon:yes gene_type:complete